MILYLLKSVACLLILLLVHRLVLQREAIYKFNRFFLLAAVIGSFFIPLVEIEVAEKRDESAQVFSQEIIPVQDFYFESFPDLASESVSEVVLAEKTMNWTLIFWTVYGLITLVFLIRFFRNINLLRHKINRNVHVQFRGETLVLLKEQSLPFSFLSYIFVSKDYLDEGQLTDSIFAHEQAHVHGRHSWDNLLIESLLVVFWFHPGLYLARQSIKLNHEFIADEAALQITPLDQYKNFLLAMMIPEKSHGLASSLNFSLTKKRFEMMKRKTTNSTKWILILSVIPVLGAMVYIFSEKVVPSSLGEEKLSEVHIFPLDLEKTEKVYDLTVYLVSGGRFLLDDVRSTKIYKMDQLSEILNQKASINPQIKLVIQAGSTMGDVEEVKSVFRSHNIKKLVWMDPDGDNKVEELGVNAYSLIYGSPIQTLTKAEYYSQTKFFIKYPDGVKEELSYDQLPEKYAKDLPNPPGKMKKSIPSSALFESWKNGDEFAIWIDGKVVPNSKLEELQVSDIAHYSSSYVNSNARSARFPQKNQVSIYTFSGFENVYGANSSFGKKPMGGSVTFNSENPKNQQHTLNSYPVSLYQAYYVQYLERLKSGSSFIDRSKTDQERLFEMFNDLIDKYHSLRTEDQPKVEPPVNPRLLHDRIEKEGETNYELNEKISEKEKSPFSKVSQISSVKNYMVTSSSYQKQLAEFEIRTNKNRLFSQPSEQEIAELQQLFNSLQVNYLNLFMEEKRKVKRANFPYAKIEREGKIIYKRMEDLTPEERQELGC
ncbi:M56 family metallopeptidase [Algoriphagus sp.]|uniref:M56 family metallopeptidase n=1 Tax=Algoriphagus sp. TaxID=1872435 RepID=UPI003918DA1E